MRNILFDLQLSCARESDCLQIFQFNVICQRFSSVYCFYSLSSSTSANKFDKFAGVKVRDSANSNVNGSGVHLKSIIDGSCINP